MFDKKKYDNENRVKITLFLSKKNDKDIIDKIDPSNKQKSLKELIRKGFESK